MKNSAWYQKLWEKKISELPLIQDADTSWSDMKELLGQELPVDISTPSKGNGKTITDKSLSAKIVSILTYILPVAAMIYGAFYLVSPGKPLHPKIEKIKHTKNNTLVSGDTAWHTIPARTTSPFITTSGKVAADTIDTIKENSGAIPGTKDKMPVSSADTASIFVKAINKSVKDIKSREENNSIQQNSLIPTPGKNVDPLAFPLPPIAAVTFHNAGRNLLPAYALSNGSKTRDTKKEKTRKEKVKKADTKRQTSKTEFMIPNYSYGITAGINLHQNKTLYFGFFGNAKISGRLTANTALLFHMPRTFTGTYTRASYFRPDSTPAFSFTDSRKLAVIEVPVTVGYQLTKQLNIKGGPVISLPLKQSAIKLGPIALPRDTLFNGANVINTISGTAVNKINYGLKAGMSFQVKQMNIDLNYQILTPYEFKNSFGTNKRSYSSIQLGVSYRLNKK